MKKMYGVITAMTTPFREDGQADLAALETMTEFLIRSGVDCLYPCGTTGEMMLMTAEQREAVAECVVRKAAGRVTVFIHVGAIRQEETIRLARHAREIGADGIGVVSPAFFGLTDRELTEYYCTVAKSIPEDFPMYLYNIPQCTTNDLSPQVCAEVAERCPNVIGVKYSYCDMHRTLDYLRIREGKFSVLVGFDRLLYPALELGCDGCVSGVSSVFPEPLVEIYRAFKAGDKEAVKKAMWLCNDIVVKLKSGSRMSIFKDVQTLRGLPGGHMQAPLLDVTEEEHRKLEELFEAYVKMFPLPEGIR
ncbi:MAG: dihydrodipicolinate synthase family protein [Lachnospiraceae bacterium]|nr:dihydrodipicolinate synthase family protein [Lachnospiraceae bacterium]